MREAGLWIQESTLRSRRPLALLRAHSVCKPPTESLHVTQRDLPLFSIDELEARLGRGVRAFAAALGTSNASGSNSVSLDRQKDYQSVDEPWSQIVKARTTQVVLELSNAGIGSMVSRRRSGRRIARIFCGCAQAGGGMANDSLGGPTNASPTSDIPLPGSLQSLPASPPKAALFKGALLSRDPTSRFGVAFARTNDFYRADHPEIR
jgi:hypothetical protein